MENKSYINCSLYQKKIEDGECFDVSMVAENFAPEWTISDFIRNIENYKKICLNCVNHRDD